MLAKEIRGRSRGLTSDNGDNSTDGNTSDADAGQGVSAPRHTKDTEVNSTHVKPSLQPHVRRRPSHKPRSKNVFDKDGSGGDSGTDSDELEEEEENAIRRRLLPAATVEV